MGTSSRARSKPGLEELRAGKPIIGIAQVGSRLYSRCTRFRRVAAAAVMTVTAVVAVLGGVFGGLYVYKHGPGFFGLVPDEYGVESYSDLLADRGISPRLKQKLGFKIETNMALMGCVFNKTNLLEQAKTANRYRTEEFPFRDWNQSVVESVVSCIVNSGHTESARWVTQQPEWRMKLSVSKQRSLEFMIDNTESGMPEVIGLRIQNSVLLGILTDAQLAALKSTVGKKMWNDSLEDFRDHVISGLLAGQDAPMSDLQVFRVQPPQ